jgi:hypothetical protein
MDTIYTKIINHKNFISFNRHMLPDNIQVEEICQCLEFLSPRVLILHGSSVSKKRYSPFGESDLDIICVTEKCGFWSMNHLYEKFRENTKNIPIKIDLSILTCSRFLSVLEVNNSALGDSLKNGFTLLWRD